MIIHTKKADSQIWWILVVAFIAIVVGILISFFFSSGLDKVKKTVGGSLDSLGDFDNDKVPNFQDKCPCTGALIQSKLLPGCPKDTTEADALKDMECYSSKDCKNCKKEETSSTDSSSPPPPPLKLQLTDETGQKITVSGYEVKGNKVFFEYSCANCQVSITLPEGMTTKAPENSNYYTLEKSGTYSFTLFENGKEIEQHTIIKK